METDHLLVLVGSDIYLPSTNELCTTVGEPLTVINKNDFVLTDCHATIMPKTFYQTTLYKAGNRTEKTKFGDNYENLFLDNMSGLLQNINNTRYDKSYSC